jgi:hypothetical protein
MMHKGMNKLAAVVLAAGILVAFMAQSGFGRWITLLDEHFDYDQEVPALRWPWFTPPEVPNIRWHYNPYAPYNRNEGINRSWNCWGDQDYIYNVRVRPQAETPHSIWCSYTNGTNVQQPLWPEDTTYCPNQNAWAWWGPFSLLHAQTAVVNFWLFNDLNYGDGDSLSVIVTNNDQLLTSNNATFRQNCAFGYYKDAAGNGYLTTFRQPIDQWARREFYLDSLRLLDANGNIRDTVSYMGERSCYIAFVWQSDARNIHGKGAFIDDVMVVWNDGLAELTPIQAYFGYPIDEENISWTTNSPRNSDSVYFRLDWTAQGVGEIGPLTIRCLLDSTEIYTEDRIVNAAADTVYSTVVDHLWRAESGHHVLQWEIDTPVDSGGRVPESDETDNVKEVAFDVDWNPPPTFEIYTPDQVATPIPIDSSLRINYSVNDSNEGSTFNIQIFWTKDTSGLAADPELIYYYNLIGFNRNAEQGEGYFDWNLAEDDSISDKDTNLVVYILGFASDGYPGNQTDAYAPGTVKLTAIPNAVKKDPLTPVTYGLAQPYPNPFNKSISIEFTMPARQEMNLSAYDLAGRHLATLMSGDLGGGRHVYNWAPDGIGAGVYLIRLETGGRSYIQKAIYTP